MSTSISRREFVGTAAVGTALALTASGTARADNAIQLAANLPQGFQPMAAPGTVVRVKKAGSLMPNQIYPKADAAKAMLERTMTELTGKASLTEAVKLFVHPQDKVCVKVNGIALSNMATNKELVLPFIDAMIASGVPAGNITVLEQYPSFLMGTRIHAQNVPAGVKVAVHNNSDATMEFVGLATP